ncbi:MAG: hypothetical protein EOP85_00450 [Verrucomicrobiaceae bacterium]|nr:MAG: hypothetical protein EOP85_00450 [Verrucomicrobiaceae bacterium]
MGYRPSKRVVWLVIPPVAVMLLGWGIWEYTDSPGRDAASRGSKPPRERGVSLAPGTWPNVFALTGDMMNVGVDTLMSANFSPWKQKDYYFGRAVMQLKYSTRPEDQAEYQRLLQTARDWHGRILARYPEMALPTEKTLAPENNGLKQLDEALKRLAAKYRGSYLSYMPLVPGPVNEYAKGFIEHQRVLVDEFRKIGLMPEGSPLGIDSDLWGKQGILHGRMVTHILVTDARLAVEQGDMARAEESVRAAMGIAGQLRMLDRGTVGSNGPDHISYHVLASILPNLPAGQADLTVWEEILVPQRQTPAELANAVRSTWSKAMTGYLLTNLSHPENPAYPQDADALVESYTRRMEALAQHAQSLDPEAPMPLPPPASIHHLSPRSQDLAKRLRMVGEDSNSLLYLWDRDRAESDLIRAAFSVMKGRPVPNDPVSGKPLLWDPAERVLKMPPNPDHPARSGIAVVVPKL